MIAYWLKYKGKLQGNIFQIDTEPLVEIPIAVSNYQSTLAILVDYILLVHRANNPQIIKYIDNELIVNAIDEVINHCVYEIYFADDLERLGLKILNELQSIESIDGIDDEVATEKVIQFYHLINEQTNQVRKNLLKTNLESKDLLAIINSHIN